MEESGQKKDRATKSTRGWLAKRAAIGAALAGAIAIAANISQIASLVLEHGRSPGPTPVPVPTLVKSRSVEGPLHPQANLLAPPSDLKVILWSESEITLFWIDNADNEAGFVVYRDGEAIAVLPANTTECYDGNFNLASARTESGVSYMVVVFDDWGHSLPSDPFVIWFGSASD